MYYLRDIATGDPVLMNRTKEPFVYTARFTADMGKKFLQRKRKGKYEVRPLGDMTT